MRRLAMLLAAAILILAFGCDATGDGSMSQSGTEPSDISDGLVQNESPLLAEGEFIDSRPAWPGREAQITTVPLPTAVAGADAVVVVDGLEIVDETDYTTPLRAGDEVIRELSISLITTYRAHVEQWVKGSGGDEIMITWWGGMTPEGPRLFDGAFLPQKGRKYLLLLGERSADSPGIGDFFTMGFGRGSFEVTDGAVHVLNHPLTRKLQEQFGGMPLEEFVDVLRGYVTNPPPPTPRPSSQPPPDSVQGTESSLIIDTVGIDTDINDSPANAVASLGSRNACNTLTTGGTLTIDVTADAVAPPDGSRGGITGFQFTLVYDPSVVKVAASDHGMLLAANAGSSLITLGDAAPDADGSFLVAVIDFDKQTATEHGPGVLARITLEAVGSGVSDLTLDGLIIVDDANKPYAIGEVLAAQVAVDAPCP